MHESKQNQANSKSQANSQSRDELQTEETFLHQEDSLMQQFSGLGNISNTNVQAQMLSRIPTSQIAANPQLMLQMQQQFGNSHVSQVVQMAREKTVQRFSGEATLQNGQRENKTGLPDNLKTGIENLSGMSMDDVKVHYNSSKPSQLDAFAYTQGADIHVAPGQERHLPHEAWHVVQQKQGRVKPSVQFKGIKANVDFLLEKEANIMGAKANDIGNIMSRLPSTSQTEQSSQLLGRPPRILQRATGNPVRQFGNGGTVINKGTEDEIIARDKLVRDGIVTDDNEILDVEVARNFIKNKISKDVVETVTRKVKQYYINDTNHFFYTATSDEAAEKILQHGLDPNFGGKRDPKSITGWNSRGYVYFTMEASTARAYGKNVIGSYTLLKFTLPRRHPVTLDPELGSQTSAFRTNVLIPAANIERA